MPGNLRQRDAAVFTRRKKPSRLRADDGYSKINERHQKTAEHARLDRTRCDCVRVRNAQLPDDLHHDDAEGKTCQYVHCVVALQKARGERLRGIGTLGCNCRDRRRGLHQRDDNQNAEKQQEKRIENLTDPRQNFAGEERKQKRCSKEHG